MASPRSYTPGTPRRGTAPYGYYKEVRMIPDECLSDEFLSQPGTPIGSGPGLCGVAAYTPSEGNERSRALGTMPEGSGAYRKRSSLSCSSTSNSTVCSITVTPRTRRRS
jgi:hypothetical protein